MDSAVSLMAASGSQPAATVPRPAIRHHGCRPSDLISELTYPTLEAANARRTRCARAEVLTVCTHEAVLCSASATAPLCLDLNGHAVGSHFCVAPPHSPALASRCALFSRL